MEPRQGGKCNFPLFISVEGKEIWVYGGGAIAKRRIGTLLDFGASIRVIAPQAQEEILALWNMGKISYEKRSFVPGEILGAGREDPLPLLVLAATDQREVNDQVVLECRERNIPVNHAGDQAQNDFFFPAVVREGELVLGLTAGGTDHKKVRRVAAWLRNHIKEMAED